MDFDYSQLDIHHEQAIVRDSKNVELWRKYIKEANSKPLEVRFLLYHRATRALPQDESLWKDFVELVTSHCQSLSFCKHRDQFLIAKKVIERALEYCPQPTIWKIVLPFIVEKMVCEVTWCREVFNHALRLLSATHHGFVFDQFLRFGNIIGGPTLQRILQQYLQFLGASNKVAIDNILDLLDDTEQDRIIMDMIRRPKSYITAHTTLALWKRLITLRYGSPGFEQIVTTAINHLPNQLARFVSTLAEIDTRKARHWFEWGLIRVKSIEQFVELFDEYLTNELQRYQKDPTPLREHFIKHLAASRTSRIVEIRLRNDSNDIIAWNLKIKQAHLSKQKLLTYVEALRKINPLKVTPGLLAAFWDAYASIYHENGDLKTADVVFTKAIASKFAPEDLVQIYEKWSEMWLSHQKPQRAIAILEQALLLGAVAELPSKYKSRLVQFYLNMLELLVDSFTSEEIERVAQGYYNVLKKRLITANQMMELAEIYQENDMWERLFKVYEQIVVNFAHPRIRLLVWRVYLEKAFSRVSESRYEDLIDHAVFGPTLANPFILDFVLLKPSASKLKRASSLLRAYKGVYARQVADDKFRLYQKLAGIMNEDLGVDEMRECYEWMVSDQGLTNYQIVEILQLYVEFETHQNQTERARALWRHITRLQHPNTPLMVPVWKKWEQWEIDNGDRSLFKDMLRWKRRIEHDLKAVEIFKDQINPMGFIASSTTNPSKINPNQIEIDMD